MCGTTFVSSHRLPFGCSKWIGGEKDFSGWFSRRNLRLAQTFSLVPQSYLPSQINPNLHHLPYPEFFHKNKKFSNR